MLHRGQLLSFESAAGHESNLVLYILHQRATVRFSRLIWDQRGSIAALVRSHLGLRKDETCAVLPPDAWLSGGFNLCVLVEATVAGRLTLVFRCPMSHKLAERQYPGTIDEKVRGEVAAYAWIQEHCHEIRIPCLYAFGFTDGLQFSHVEQAPFYTRISRSFQRWVHRILGLSLLSNYSRNTTLPTVDTAYMLLEYISPETGTMLSETWNEYMHDAQRVHPYSEASHIGSFRFNPRDATITLSNRPLMCSTMLFEKSGTPRTIQPHQTYQTTDSFVSETLTLYDNHLLHDPHAVRDEDDARERITIRTLLRALSHHFLTDFHQSNIFVDKDWNITCLMDLQWLCALPSEMLSVPSWLANCSLDNIIGKRYDHFNEARKVFLDVMDEEAQSIRQEHDIQVTDTMRHSWSSKRVWFWACLRSTNAWLFIFEDHILPRFSDDKELVVSLKQMSVLWRDDVEDVIKAKVQDEEKYREELLHLINDQEQGIENSRE
ncbi:uncharacterized protein F5Z01DRAFT_740979 [Emericellopsis atlantica]|uniref:Aminoglycoside phosphotransferase domain-containing protein n=1 Tax=Emericellopsis atlantica TaxID=2614577 RepID=A0A9P8CTU5_9HYPO|nr:uncharacterized protein F5Z01DRAFT_740979 [Emericellopsis atlantica]KAG9259153.1 hypothetical protein F5Z01DRAFT_740979 [Emericellopsis atlantica]